MFEKASEHLRNSLLMLEIGWKSSGNRKPCFEVVENYSTTSVIFRSRRESSVIFGGRREIFGNLQKLPKIFGDFQRSKNIYGFLTLKLKLLKNLMRAKALRDLHHK